MRVCPIVDTPSIGYSNTILQISILWYFLVESRFRLLVFNKGKAQADIIMSVVMIRLSAIPHTAES